MTRFLLTCIVCWGLCGRSLAEDSFLGLAFGGRPLALGGAYTAVADDAQATLWNPAGLAQMSGFSFAGSQNHLSFTDNAYAVSLTGALGPWGTASVAIQHLVVQNIAMTRPVLDGNGNPVLDPSTNQPLVEIAGFGQESDATFLVGYGVAVTHWLMIGGAGKWLVGKAGRTSGSGFGADAGMLVRLARHWRVGVAADDLGRTTVRWRDGVRTVLPSAGRLGVAWEPYPKWLVSVEGASPLAKLRVVTGAGVEWRYAEFLAFRAGLNDGRVTGGAGFRMRLGAGPSFASADYAFVTGSQYEDRNRLTLGVTF